MQAEKTKKKKKRMKLPNGLGSVHLIGDAKRRRKPWRARVPSHVEIDHESGTAKQKYITIGYYETEIEALDALMQYRKNPYTLEAATCTFSDVFEQWKAKKYPEVSISSQRAYNGAYNHSAPLYNMKMRDIRAMHMDQIMQDIVGGYQLQSKLKLLWGQLFQYAMENDIVQKNYAEFVKTRDKDEGTKRTDISKEDRAKLWEAIDQGDRDAELVMIYIYTGMRPSELLDVKKADVDLNARIMVGGLKTEAGKDRRIPLHRCIIPFMERLMQTEGEYLVMRQVRDKPKKLYYKVYLDDVWNALSERLGFTQYTPHYTRHTTATMLREANVEEDIRKLILGHKNQDITNRYTHHPDYMLIEAIDKLPGR